MRIMNSSLRFSILIILLSKTVFGLESTLGNKNGESQVTEEPFFTEEFSTEGSSESHIRKKDFSCQFAPGIVPGDRDRVLYCCNRIVVKYERGWAGRSLPLNQYLANLKSWNCPQFQEECKRRLFVFNSFTELMYDYFCNYSILVDKCIQNVTETIAHVQKRAALVKQFLPDKDDDKNQSINNWKKLISCIDPSKMTLKELLFPCIQVAQYDQEEIHDGSYQELIDFGIPSCPVAWCGLGGEALKHHHVSLWNCLSTGCRTRVVIIMVFCGVLGLAITIVNILIISVISLNKNLKNSQSTYKLSLAAADLVVGVVVLPCAIDILRRLLWTRYELDGYHVVRGYSINNDSSSDQNVISLNVFDKAGQFSTKFPKHYQNFAGFFLAVSIFVSVYTLAGAGFDRLRAVYAPLSYRKERALKLAKRICLISWVAAVVFGLLPLFTPRLTYGLILSIIFATLDFYGVILYAVGLFIPLLIVWIINILTFTVSKKHSKFRRQLTRDSRRKGQIVERKLAATLRLMVGVFTFNTTPILVLLACSYAFSTIHPSYPRKFKENEAVAFLTAQFVAAMLLFGNSMWNFFIYNIKNRDFRIDLRKWFKRILQKLGFSSCFQSTMLCYRRAVFTSRKRLTSFQSFSRMSVTKRKKGSITAVTEVLNMTNVNDRAAHAFRNPGHLVDDTLTIAGGRTVPTESTQIANETTLTKARETTQVTYDESTVVVTESLFELSTADNANNK